MSGSARCDAGSEVPRITYLDTGVLIAFAQGDHALHAAAAMSCAASEIVTTERPTKPLFRLRGIEVTSIASS